MRKAYKLEVKLNEKQKVEFAKTIGCCRLVYNMFIDFNKTNYNKGIKFINYMQYSKYLNNEYLKEHPEKLFIKEVSSKSIKQSLKNANTAYTNFLKGKCKFPKFKKKHKNKVKMYFVKNNKTDFKVYRHKIKLPILGFVTLKQFNYIKPHHNIKSATLEKRANKYFLSILVEEDIKFVNNTNDGIGRDLGFYKLAYLSNGFYFKNPTKDKKYKKLEKRLKREQRKLSRKIKIQKLKENNKKKGERSKNFFRQIEKIQRTYLKLDNYLTNKHNKIINEIIKLKPNFITIEDLKIKNMLKNKRLSNAIHKSRLSNFKMKLIKKAIQNSIEIRQADTFYPSSKTCFNCKQIKTDLKLSNRTYKCSNCSFEIDRDLNASLNLKNLDKYKIITA